jgi:HD-GYP domain-containing protein (c-di-GMP phosphodiesterase class II)
VSSAVSGKEGYYRDVLIDGELCNLFYAPVSLFEKGNEGEFYSVMLVHKRSEVALIRFRIFTIIGLFLLVLVVLVFLIFKRLLRKQIVDPLEVLINSMKTTDLEDFKEIQLDRGDEFDDLAGNYNDLGRKLMEQLESLKASESGYKSFAEIGLAFSREKNISHLLELILEESRKLTLADGGTLYLFNSETEELDFSILRNETLNFHMGGSSEQEVTLPPVPLYKKGEPNCSNVSSYSALTSEVINISDVYTEEGFDFSGTRFYDKNNGYRSKSMLVVPMKNMENDLIGVIQLINARKADSDQIIPFSTAMENLTISLASQAAVALTNVQLNKDLENLFNSFIRSIATAIDEKSSYTGGHIRRVVVLTMMIANEMNREDQGVFAHISFTPDELEELRTAAWMHDVGKISTPEWIMDKKTKLEEYHDRIDIVEMRYHLILQILSTGENGELNLNRDELLDELEFLKSCNHPEEYLSEEKTERLEKIFNRKIHYGGREIPFLTGKEYMKLSIRKGSLDQEERRIVEHHAVTTRKILSELPFPKKLSKVQEYASMHHERLDGSGYPDGISGDQIPLQARIIAIADILEALIAKDRPYRKPISLPRALEIMNYMVRDGFIDGDILDFITSKGLVDKYILNELNQ